MRKNKKTKQIVKQRQVSRLNLLIALIASVIVCVLMLVANTPKRYSLSVGMVPQYTIAATKDVVDHVTTKQRQDEAANAVQPVYKYQNSITENVLYNLDQVFTQLRAVREYAKTLPNPSSRRVFTTEELAYARTILVLIDLKDYQLTTLLQTPSENLEALYTPLYNATANTMNGHVNEGDEAEAVRSILQIIGFGVDPSLLQNVVQPVLKYCIQANMIIDEEATLAKEEEARNAVEPIIYKQGQNIVVKGEGRIRQYQIAMLSELGLLSNEGVDTNTYVGGAVFALMTMALCYVVLYHLDRESFCDRTKLLIASITIVLSFGVCILARLINSYLMPVLLCGMLVTNLVSKRFGLVCNVTLSLLAAALAAGGNEAYVEQTVLIMTATIISGTIVCLLLSRDRASRLVSLLSGLLGAVTDFVVFLSVQFLTASTGVMSATWLNSISANSLMRCAGTLISTLLYMGIQPVMELIFNLPTSYKLQELGNLNRPLLKRLLIEAPGTYHHSMVVANLCEASAEAIGANSLLAKVAAYYHDIGKLKRPLYFKENQQNDYNPHDKTDPLVSASIVTSHVKDGVAMARDAHLPEAVIRMISEHHGDTPVMFFYHKALQQADGKPVDIRDFRYNGHPPTTRESAILMLCDTIEAAVRTLKSPTPDVLESFIVKLVRGKIVDGQLSNCPLTLKDIDKICAACKTVLVGVFHERIEYPDVPEESLRTMGVQGQRSSENSPDAGNAAAPAQTETSEGIVVPEPKIVPIPVVEPGVKPIVPIIEPEDLTAGKDRNASDNEVPAE
ncbi:MAG: HDIG domain-containing protein [Clostridia bacterium]|nr:HDIG domain-containing protein [Clostridia bacterium]